MVEHPIESRSIRLAVAQPRIEGTSLEESRVQEAVDFIRSAGRERADLVLFPEGYPGPLRITSDYDAAGPVTAAASENEIAVCWSRVERCDDDTWRKVAYLTGPDGGELLRYERVHPATGDVHPTLSGTHLTPGDEFATAEVAGVRIGILICSELWVPEVARILALRGAEVLLAPAGGGFHRVAENWKLVSRTRAIENQCYLAMTQHLFDDEAGSALIAGPERVVRELAGPGLMVADLDLERVRWLRTTDDSMDEPKQFDSLPGLLRMRRPGSYSEIASPRKGLYDYRNPPTVPDELLEPGAFRGDGEPE